MERPCRFTQVLGKLIDIIKETHLPRVVMISEAARPRVDESFSNQRIHHKSK